MGGLTFAEELVVAVIGGLIAAAGGGLAVYTQLGVTQQRREVRNSVLDGDVSLSLSRRVQAAAILLDPSNQASAAEFLTDLDGYERRTVREAAEALTQSADTLDRASRWDSRMVARFTNSALDFDRSNPGKDELRQILKAIFRVRLYLARRLRTGSIFGRFTGYLSDRSRTRAWNRDGPQFIAPDSTAGAAYEILRAARQTHEPEARAL